MKLSELIREGSKDRKQLHFGFVQAQYPDDIDGPLEYAACALGAACFACGVNESEIKALSAKLIQSPGSAAHEILGRCTDIDRLEREMVDHPGVIDRSPIATIVVSLNDDYRWSFEQIIQWLESIGE